MVSRPGQTMYGGAGWSGSKGPARSTANTHRQIRTCPMSEPQPPHTLQRMLISHSQIEILVHSTWRHRYDLQELRLLLGDVFGPRVVAAAPAGDDRWLSIQACVADETESLDLLILDDAPSEFPTSMPFTLVVCNPARGLSDLGVQRSIRQCLDRTQRRRTSR